MQETYTYDGFGGRISSVTTEVVVGGSPRFDYSLAYDPLGNVSSRSYPRCAHDFCAGSAVSPFRAVTAG